MDMFFSGLTIFNKCNKKPNPRHCLRTPTYIMITKCTKVGYFSWLASLCEKNPDRIHSKYNLTLIAKSSRSQSSTRVFPNQCICTKAQNLCTVCPSNYPLLILTRPSFQARLVSWTPCDTCNPPSLGQILVSFFLHLSVYYLENAWIFVENIRKYRKTHILEIVIKGFFSSMPLAHWFPKWYAGKYAICTFGLPRILPPPKKKIMIVVDGPFFGLKLTLLWT